MVQDGNKAKCLLSVNHTTKTIHQFVTFPNPLERHILLISSLNPDSLAQNVPFYGSVMLGATLYWTLSLINTGFHC